MKEKLDITYCYDMNYVPSIRIFSNRKLKRPGQLAEHLNANPPPEIAYFHKLSYSRSHSDPPPDFNFGADNLRNLKFLSIKGWAFPFSESVDPQSPEPVDPQSPESTEPKFELEYLLEYLRDRSNYCKKLEHIQISSVSSEELNAAFEALVDLIKNNSTIQTLTIRNQYIDCPNFKVLCQFLQASPRVFELAFRGNITLSAQNRRLLKRGPLSQDGKLTVSGRISETESCRMSEIMGEDIYAPEKNIHIKNIESSTEKQDTLNFFNIYMPILHGFITGLGIIAVIAAFTLLNAATFNVPGLIVASGVGAAAILTEIGMFCARASKHSEEIPDASMNAQQNAQPVC